MVTRTIVDILKGAMFFVHVHCTADLETAGDWMVFLVMTTTRSKTTIDCPVGTNTNSIATKQNTK